MKFIIGIIRRAVWLKHFLSTEILSATPYSTMQCHNNVLFRQLYDRETCTYTYLMADKDTKEAILIDPVIDLADRDANLIREHGLTLKYAMNTHCHADHITGTGMLKKILPGSKSLISENSGATADIFVKHGDIVTFGNQNLEVRATPGHTNGCITYVDHTNGIAFTGDALLIRGCGRTDFQEGCAKKLYESVHSHIFNLPSHYLVYPGHDYNGNTVSTIEEERQFNPRLTKDENLFIDLMGNLNMAYPKKIDISVPANKVCGLYNLPEELAEKLKSLG